MTKKSGNQKTKTKSQKREPQRWGSQFKDPIETEYGPA